MESTAHTCILNDLKEWGPTFSNVKTKLLVAGDRDADDMKPPRLNGDEAVCMTEIKYSKGGMHRRWERGVIK